MSSMLSSIVLRLRFLLFDVDGVLTDGRLYYIGDEVAVAFDTKDGLAVKRAREAGLGVGLLSARRDSPAVARRVADLGFDEALLGCRDKAAAFADLLERRGLQASESRLRWRRPGRPPRPARRRSLRRPRRRGRRSPRKRRPRPRRPRRPRRRPRTRRPDHRRPRPGLVATGCAAYWVRGPPGRHPPKAESGTGPVSRRRVDAHRTDVVGVSCRPMFGPIGMQEMLFIMAAASPHLRPKEAA